MDTGQRSPTRDAGRVAGGTAHQPSPKHRPPALTTRTVRRTGTPPPRPLEFATERGTGTLVLLAGSVGTGKTTLLSTWAGDLADRGDLVGWATLDREDNEPQVLAATLFGALRAAAAHVVPELADESLPSPVGQALVLRLTELAAQAPADVWLLLDDVHLVRDPRGLELLDLVARWAPPRLHVAIATRADPGLHLARLRLDERLLEVREQQLRFSLDETRRLLELHGLELADEHVRGLQELTEGWAAGVTLAAVSLSRGRDPEAFLREFARSNQAMSGYLVEEVLSGLDEPTRDFLVATSVLDEVTAEVAAAVTGRDDAGALLASLSSDNAMVGVDPVGTPTYRYHVLLRSYLSAMLEASSLRGAREVHARAARWYVEHDLPGRALVHAEAAGDLDIVEDVLHHHALHLLLDGRAADLEAAVRTVDAADPMLTAVAALASLDQSDSRSAQAQLATVATAAVASGGDEPSAESAQQSADPAQPIPVERLLAVGLRWLSFVGGADLVRSVVEGADRVGGAHATLAMGVAADLAATLSARDTTVDSPSASSTIGAGADSGPRAYAAPRPWHQQPAAGRRVPHAQVDIALLDELTSGGVLMGAGRFADAAAAYGSALMTARAAGHTLSALQAMTGLASVAAAQEDLNGMRQWSERVIEESSRTPWVASPRLLPAHVLAAWASFQVLDTGRARTRNEVALRMLPEIPEDPAGSDQGAPGETAGEAASETAGSASPARRGIEQLGRLARLLQAYLDLDESGDAPGARREVAERIMTSARVVRSLSMTDSMAGAELASMHRLVVLAGFPRLALEVEQLCARMLVSRHELATMTATRLLGSGDDAGARASVASVLAADPASLPLRTAVTARLVRAVVAHRNAQPSVAHEALVEALGLAAPQHALRMVLQVAPEVVEVLAVGAGRFGALEPFAQELLDHPHGAAAPVGDRPLDVALSVRELTLLRELPSLLTVSEIASARVVSPNTVKTQLRSLFQKLGVNSRRDAVAAARRLGLL